MTARTMAFGFVPLMSGGELNIALHTAESPSAGEWADYVAALRRRAKAANEVAKGIILTDGGAPSSAQRKDLITLLEGKTMPTSIVSSAPVLRGVATALSWFNPNVKSFGPDAIDAALGHLKLAPREIRAAVSEIDRLYAVFGPGELTWVGGWIARGS